MSLFKHSTRASQKVVYQDVFLLNGGSREMSVNGSVTEVEFSAGPSAGDVWEIVNINFVLQDNGSTSADEFGARSALTNGLQIDQYIGSVDYELVNLQSNADVLAVFTQAGWFGGAASGFVTDANYFNGHFPLRETPVVLDGDDGDLIKGVVRDNLTAINKVNISIAYRMVL